MAGSTYGMDLGSGSIKIYRKSDDKILNEKNMIAIENKTRLFAYGDNAFNMYEKAPANIVISYPVTNGVIADINNMQTLLKCFIQKMSNGSNKNSDFYIAVPTDVTEVEKRAFFDLVKDSNIKARKIMVVEKAIADGLGLDIDVMNSQGTLIVNIGFDTTEISILSLGGIVLSKLIKVGGQKLDDAVKNVIRREYNLIIGSKTAEKLKITLNELNDDTTEAIVYGRDIVTGLPVERSIPTPLVHDCLKESFDLIIDNIKVILEKTPPELAADIYRKGLYLTGGAANAGHLKDMIHADTGLKVNLSDSPSESVVRGLAKIIEDDAYQSVAYSIEGMTNKG